MNSKDCIDIFICSYHRPHNVKTMKYLCGLGYPSDKIHVFVDSATDDIAEYEEEVVGRYKCNLHVFDMDEARARYDYVHRASESRRSAGQARNMFMDWATANGIDFYMVCDDDTSSFQIRPFGKYYKQANINDIVDTFLAVRDMMKKRKVGLFGLSQTGDIYSNEHDTHLFRRKVMNTTFVLLPYVYRGERGIQDDDTSLFTGVMNEGLFTGSLYSGLVLLQTLSATQSGGLTDLYNECKLLNKAMVTPLQFPSAIFAERQIMNGARIHHHVRYDNLFPKIIKGSPGHNNIEWDTYAEDIPFTNEPKRCFTLNR